MIIVEVSNLIG